MLKCDFSKVKTIEITLRHRCSPVNLLHIFGTLRTPLDSWFWSNQRKGAIMFLSQLHRFSTHLMYFAVFEIVTKFVVRLQQMLHLEYSAIV